jgi:hypothetical protein
MVLCLTQWGNKSAVLSAPGVRLSSVYSRLMGRASVWGLPGVRDSQSNPIQSFGVLYVLYPSLQHPSLLWSAPCLCQSTLSIYIYIFVYGRVGRANEP